MAEQSVDYSKKHLSITETKARVGKLSRLELVQARTSLIEQEYSLNEYRQNSFENLNALKSLLNLNPSESLPYDLKIPEKMPNRIFKNIKSLLIN